MSSGRLLRRSSRSLSPSEAVARLFDGEVAVETADDGTLTLTRDGVELVLTPEG